jgi:hypothetical protein
MRRLLLLPLLAALLAGCSGTYYRAMEKLGVPKRQILVDRVQAARGSQEQAKQTFANALEEFIAVTRVEPTELKATYDRLNEEFKRCEARARDVRDRIAAIDNVAKALFAEWRDELSQYSNASLRAQSERQLAATRRRYEELMRLMDAAADRMEPVLATFRDQTLFLKHNLNAQAIASLDTTARNLQQDIRQLIADMDKSIREADAFIAAMQQQK